MTREPDKPESATSPTPIDAPKPGRRRLLLFLRLIPLVLLGLVLWKTRPWEIDLGNVLLWPLFVLMAINYFICVPIKGYRWQCVIPDPPPLLTVCAAMLEGLLANMTVGLGSGDVVRSARLRPGAETFSTDFGTALGERATEYFALAFMLLATFILGATNWIAAMLAGIVILAYVVVLRWGSFVVKRVSRWPDVAAGVEAALATLSPKKILVLTCLSLAYWVAETVMLMLALYAFGLPSDPGTAALVLVGINAAIAIPSAPANLGTYEAGIVAALAFQGVGTTVALGFALAYHLLNIVPTSIIATAVFLIRGDGKRKQPEE